MTTDNQKGVTALHRACEEDDVSVAQLWIREGANPVAKDKVVIDVTTDKQTGRTPLDLILEHNHSNLFHEIIGLKKWEKDILCWACERNDTETVQLLLQRGVDPSGANQKVKVFL